MALVGKESGIHTPEFHKKKVRESRIKNALITFVVLTILILPVVFFRLERFLISDVELIGNEVTSREEIEEVTNKELKGNYLFVFPRAHALLYPEESIETKLLEEVPRLSSVDVYQEGKKTIVVEMKERAPEALYCITISPGVFENCYFLDTTGYIFSKSPSFSEGVYAVYGSNPVIEDPLGEQFLEESEFEKLKHFNELFENGGIRRTAIIAEDEKIVAILPRGGRITVKSDEDIDKAFSNIISFLNDRTFQDEPDHWTRLNYIDVRGNKIYFEFKDTQTESEETENE